MVAFVPISPKAAREILIVVGAADDGVFLSKFVGAGKIKAYASVTETLPHDGRRSGVRDGRIEPALWRRIVAEGKLDEVWDCACVELDGDGLAGGRPAVTITGIRFNEDNVRRVAAEHGSSAPAPMTAVPPVAAPQPDFPAVLVSSPVRRQPLAEIAIAPVGPSIALADTSSAAAPKQRTALPDGDVMVSIADAMGILDVSRGTIGNMIKRGQLEARKIGARTLIPADSIRSVIKAAV